MAAPSDSVDTTPLEEDLEWCHQVVQDVSRTFTITIDVLAEPISTSICIGYLLCRIPDTVEDAGHIPSEEKAQLLRTYDSVLDPESETEVDAFTTDVSEWIPGDPNADWSLVAETERVVRAFDAQSEQVREAIRPPARELVSGMATFVERYAAEGGLRVQARSELHEYCHYAAGTVGELVTNLVTDSDTPAEVRDPLAANAEAFGLALQLVNICKDVGADFHEENNVYLPADELTAEGVSQDDLGDPANADGVAAVVRRTVDDARDSLDEAQVWLEHVPERRGNRMAAWAIPYLLAVATLREVESRPLDVLHPDGVKITREEVGTIIGRCVDDIDGEELADMRERIAAGQLS